MFNLFGFSFTLLGLIGMILLTGFLLSQVCYWVFGAYFPARKLCVQVHKSSGNWLANERKYLKFLEAPSVFGFISAILLSGTVLLNVIILAMIFELFVPVGVIVELPYLGSYGSFPLLVGALFALVEISFSALAEQNKKMNKSRWHVYSILAVMIFMEAALNFYRTKIMEEGMMVMSSSFLDQMLGWGGPVLAAFLGFIVPLSLVLLGGYAMLDFIMPVIKNSAILIRVCVSHLFIYLAILLFGFHPKVPVELLSPIARLKNTVARLKELALELNKKLGILKQQYPKVQILLPNENSKLDDKIAEMNVKVLELETQKEVLKNAFSNNVIDSEAVAQSFSGKSHLRTAIINLKEHIRDVRAELLKIDSGFADVSENTSRFLKSAKLLSHEAQYYLEHFEQAVNVKNELSHLISEAHIDEFMKELEWAFNQKSKEFDYILSSDVHEINTLLDCVKSNKKDSHWHRLCLDQCNREIDTAKMDMVQVSNSLSENTRWLTDHELVNETQTQTQVEQTMRDLDHRLNELDIHVSKTEKDLNDQFEEFQINLRELAWKMHAYIIWFSLFFSLQKRV